MKPISPASFDIQSMIDAFHTETDRGAAVLAGSYVENHLGLYIKSRMTDQSIAERLFTSEGALSTFSQRIDLAQAFGLLTEVQCKDLHLIKKIRNHFAHTPKHASFEVSPVCDWASNLVASRRKIKMPDGSIQNVGDARFHFLISAGIFIAITPIR